MCVSGFSSEKGRQNNLYRNYIFHYIFHHFSANGNILLAIHNKMFKVRAKT